MRLFLLFLGFSFLLTNCAKKSAAGADGDGSGSGAGGFLVTTPIGLPDGATADGSVTFQNGLSSYSGATAVNISDSGYTGSNNGTTFADKLNGWFIGQLHGVGGFGYDISPLFRFADVWVPDGKTVLAVSLEMTFINWDSSFAGSVLVGRYLNKEWDYDFTETSGGTGSAPVGWKTATTGSDWSTPGALGEGTDLVAGIAFHLPATGTTTAEGKQVYTTWLDPEIVQNWISNPGENYGFKLQADGLNKHTSVEGPARPVTTDTPKLTIYYH